MKKMMLSVAILAFAIVILPSCQALGQHRGAAAGGAIGGGAGYGISRAAGLSGGQTAAVTLLSAGGGALIGHMNDKARLSEDEYKNLIRTSRECTDIAPVVENRLDGTTAKRIPYFHQDTGRRWDRIMIWSAPRGNSAPAVVEDYAIWL